MALSPIKLFLIALVCLHVFLCPYTKVEESFNLQAMHDLLFFKSHIGLYDHHEFPGVVPRSFIGPLIVSISSSPFALAFQYFSLPKLFSQYLVRITLALLCTGSLFHFKHAVTAKFGEKVSNLTLLLLGLQFHFLFYLSRPLPNTFAMIFVLRAIAAWLHQRHAALISWLSIGMMIFRSDIALLAGPIILVEMIFKKLSFFQFFLIGALVSAAAITATVLIDSYFWQRWLWPEAEVFYFNTILNKSGEWGVSPFHWYFTSVLPRVFGLWSIFVPFSLVFSPTSRPYFAAVLSFVLLYSFLPHKELRFIMYIFPIWNMFAAVGCFGLHSWTGKQHKLLRLALNLFILLCCVTSIFTTALAVKASANNYPGAALLEAVHTQHPTSIHIASAPAQSGISRFLEQDNVIYSKAEKWDNTVYPAEFQWLLVAEDDVVTYEKTHSPQFYNASLTWKLGKAFPFISLVEREKLFALKRISDIPAVPVVVSQGETDTVLAAQTVADDAMAARPHDEV